MRWIWWLLLAVLLAALIVVVVCCCCRRHGEGPGDDKRPACPGTPRAATASGAPQPWEDDKCQPDGCGLNGAWLGEGVRFRTLHVTPGKSNEVYLTIEKFTKGSEALTLDVAGDELLGRRTSGGPLKGGALAGAEVLLRDTKHNTTYTFQIKGVTYKRFWTHCSPDASDCKEEPHEVPFYRFFATDGRGCQVQLCRPGLGEEDDDALSGTAVIFKGDVYDDATYEVRTGDMLTPDEKDLFNIACVGTAISKLHMLRHTEASQDPQHTTRIEQRQTLLRLLTADYCGIGHPFTEDGHELQMTFKKGSWNSGPAYDIRDALSIDARWDQHGATCLGKPRLSDRYTEQRVRTAIERLCSGPHTAGCAANTNPVAGSADIYQGSYAVSGNPFR